MTTVGLAIGLAAALAPAAQASFPDGDAPVARGNGGGPGLAERTRIEPRVPAEAIPATPAATAEPVGGFDWADAAVGAGVALGSSVLVGGTLVAIRRHGDRGRLATR